MFKCCRTCRKETGEKIKHQRALLGVLLIIIKRKNTNGFKKEETERETVRKKQKSVRVDLISVRMCAYVR